MMMTTTTIRKIKKTQMRKAASRSINIAAEKG